MPAPTESRVRRDGDALVFTGTLSRERVPALWQPALDASASARRLVLDGVDRVDSAGLALLAELAARMGPGVAVSGTPVGLADLRAAYRLDDALAFAA
jgi:phospholipid transport system transporter-binding protein